MQESCPKCGGKWSLVEVKMLRDGVEVAVDYLVQCPQCGLELSERKK